LFTRVRRDLCTVMANLAGRPVKLHEQDEVRIQNHAAHSGAGQRPMAGFGPCEFKPWQRRGLSAIAVACPSDNASVTAGELAAIDGYDELRRSALRSACGTEGFRRPRRRSLGYILVLPEGQRAKPSNRPTQRENMARATAYRLAAPTQPCARARVDVRALHTWNRGGGGGRGWSPPT
jgi:hypothetical protein